MTQKVKSVDLQLADRVMRLKNDGTPDLELGISTVKQTMGGTIHLFRPYTHTADFSCTSGVICYVGTEEYRVEADQTEWLLLQRKKLK